MKSFIFITEKATQVSDSWSNKQIVAFHYFNPNGLYSKLKAMNATISQYVESGHIKSGWLMVHGSLHSMPYKWLSELYNMKRVPTYKLTACLGYITEEIDKGYMELATHLDAVSEEVV